jgi:hypothetical protein
VGLCVELRGQQVLHRLALPLDRRVARIGRIRVVRVGASGVTGDIALDRFEKFIETRTNLVRGWGQGDEEISATIPVLDVFKHF